VKKGAVASLTTVAPVLDGDLPEGLVPVETFVTLYVWDSLDRLNRISDNAGQTATTMTYDSRDQLTDTSDAVGPLVQDPLNLYAAGKINSAGNTCHYYHDGSPPLDLEGLRPEGRRPGRQRPRHVESPSPNSTITTTYKWDLNSRLQSIADDKGNLTYLLDELDRPIQETGDITVLPSPTRSVRTETSAPPCFRLS
jgi:YD repeat-containing protein